jgi:SAM-dependent methyltransferase
VADTALITAAEIARLAGVGRAAVSNWRRRHVDFPEAVAGSAGTPTFRLDEVERWLRARGKLSVVAPADALWRAVESEPNVLELIADIAIALQEPAAVHLPDPIRDVLNQGADDSPDDIVDSLCVRAFERQQRQHLVTPVELAKLMIDLAAPVSGTVFDPACGSGNLLRIAASAGAERLLGQEIDEQLARITRARVGATEGEHIVAGDALRSDAFVDLRADVVVCDPPFGNRDWGHEELALDPRWGYGVPPKGEPEFAWVQHCLAHVKPGGTVVVALPASVASRRSGRSIRRTLLQRGALRAVAALPAGVLMSTGIPIHLWVLRRPDTGRADSVLLVDLGHHQPPRRGGVEWRALGDDLLGMWREFRDTDAVTEIPGQCRAVEPIELLDEDVDLTPARHLPQPPVVVDAAELKRTRERMTRSLGELGALLPDVRATARHSRVSTTINDLARAGALVLHQQVRPLDTAEDGTGPLVLTGRDVTSGQAPNVRYAGTDWDDLLCLRPCDLVVPLLAAGDGLLRTWVIENDDLLLGPNLQLIRVDGSRLDVHFLAGQIRAATKSRAVGATASGVRRVDARRIEIPVLDLDRQRQLGTVFRRLEAFEQGLREATDLGIHLTVRLTEGLAAGMVEPDE